MKIVAYLDNDQLNKPEVDEATVYAVGEETPLTKEHLIQRYPSVFSAGVGQLEGEYHIRLDPQVSMLHDRCQWHTERPSEIHWKTL